MNPLENTRDAVLVIATSVPPFKYVLRRSSTSPFRNRLPLPDVVSVVPDEEFVPASPVMGPSRYRTFGEPTPNVTTPPPGNPAWFDRWIGPEKWLWFAFVPAPTSNVCPGKNVNAEGLALEVSQT